MWADHTQIAPLSGRAPSEAFTRYAGARRRQPDSSEVSFAGLDFPDRVPVLPFVRVRLGDGSRKFVRRLYPIAPREPLTAAE